MRFFDYVRLAFRNLSRQKSRTFLTIVAITVGSLSLILMASLIIGIRQSLVDQFKSFGAFNLVTVTKDPNSTDQNNLMGTGGDTSEGKTISDTTLGQVKRLPHVVNATGILNVNASTMRLASQDKKTWASVVSYDPASNVFDLPITFGRSLTSADMDKIVVGSRFLDDFGMRGKEKDLLGKKVIFNSKMGGPGSGIDWGALPAKPPQNADESWYKSQQATYKGIDIEAEIVGVTDSGAVSDQNYINIAWARKLNTQVRWEYPKCEKDQQCSNVMTLVKDDNFLSAGYASIIAKLDDENNVSDVSSQITKLGYGSVTAQAMLANINKIMTLVGIVLGLIAGISLFVAGIGIVNTMIMATYERTKEIGVMRACGATRAVIRRLFTIEAASLGFLGGMFGVILSMFLGQIAKFLVTRFGANLGQVPVDNVGNFPLWLIGAILLFTTFVGLVSGLYPAIKASRLKPVEALRYE